MENNKEVAYKIWDNGNKCAVVKIGKLTSERNEEFNKHITKGDYFYVIPDYCDHDNNFDLNCRRSSIYDLFSEYLNNKDAFGLLGKPIDYDICEDEEIDENISSEEVLSIIREHKDDIDRSEFCHILINILNNKEVQAGYIYSRDVTEEKPGFIKFDFFAPGEDYYNVNGVIIANIRDGESREDALCRLKKYFSDYQDFHNDKLNLYHGKIFEKQNGKWVNTVSEDYLEESIDNVFSFMNIKDVKEDENFKNEDIEYVKNNIKIEKEEVFSFLEKSCNKL